MKYSEVLDDWEYLFEQIGVADDMTGGYVDQYDLYEMLKNPTKRQAAKCLKSQIVYWLQMGPEKDLALVEYNGSLIDLSKDHPRINEIAEKYCVEVMF